MLMINNVGNWFRLATAYLFSQIVVAASELELSAIVGWGRSALTFASCCHFALAVSVNTVEKGGAVNRLNKINK